MGDEGGPSALAEHGKPEIGRRPSKNERHSDAGHHHSAAPTVCQRSAVRPHPVAVACAPGTVSVARQSIFAYDRTSTGAQDYQHVVEELLGHRRAVASSGTVSPFRHQRRGPGGRKAPKSGRAAQADSR